MGAMRWHSSDMTPWEQNCCLLLIPDHLLSGIGCKPPYAQADVKFVAQEFRAGIIFETTLNAYSLVGSIDRT